MLDPAGCYAYGIKFILPGLLAKLVDFLGVCLWGKKSVINCMSNIQWKKILGPVGAFLVVVDQLVRRRIV